MLNKIFDMILFDILSFASIAGAYWIPGQPVKNADQPDTLPVATYNSFIIQKERMTLPAVSCVHRLRSHFPDQS